MAHFAKMKNNVVLDVLVVDDSVLFNENREEIEQKGIDFLFNITGHKEWIQTSFSEKFRKNFAGKGYYYDELKDAFIAPQPFLNWKLNETTCKWEAPIEMPKDGNIYIWSDLNSDWVKK
jgi:hypothetical protein